MCLSIKEIKTVMTDYFLPIENVINIYIFNRRNVEYVSHILK